MDYNKPADVVATMIDTGQKKLALAPRDLLIRGALSGALLGAWRRVVQAPRGARGLDSTACSSSFSSRLRSIRTYSGRAFVDSS